MKKNKYYYRIISDKLTTFTLFKKYKCVDINKDFIYIKDDNGNICSFKKHVANKFFTDDKEYVENRFKKLINFLEVDNDELYSKMSKNIDKINKYTKLINEL